MIMPQKLMTPAISYSPSNMTTFPVTTYQSNKMVLNKKQPQSELQLYFSAVQKAAIPVTS